MSASPQPTGGGRDAGPIAGRIAAAENSLEALLIEWETHLRGRKCAATSVSAMLGEVRRAIRERGWTGPGDFTYREVIGYLDSHEDWAAATYNRNLSVFRSLTRWLDACEIIPQDTLRHALRADGAGGPGARAATTDEARAIVRTAWLREQTDGRARRAPRSLYWACLFLSGARFGEPARWRWRDLLLDEAPAVLTWTPETQKANRREELVICGELAGLLRAWRDAPDHVADLSKMVFPVAPHKRSWADDRSRAGLARNDTRGRPLSAHSARKWFKTELVRAGVHADLIDRLMRHAAGVGSRYYDPTPAEMAAAVGCLPQIWPAQIIEPQAFATLSPKSSPKCLDSRAEIADALTVTPMNTNPCQPANPRPPADCIGVTSERSAGTGIPALSRSGANGPQTLSRVGARNGDFGRDNCGADFGQSGETGWVVRAVANFHPHETIQGSVGGEGVGFADPRVRPGAPSVPPSSPGRDAEGHHRDDALADVLEAWARSLRARGGER